MSRGLGVALVMIAWIAAAGCIVFDDAGVAAPPKPRDRREIVDHDDGGGDTGADGGDAGEETSLDDGRDAGPVEYRVDAH